MPLIVMKFGGTSLANTKLMNNAAAKVMSAVSQGNKVIVVVSAMAGVTDHLVSLVQEITELDNFASHAEYASVITTGEQISAGLFALSLQQAGIRARSWLGFQAGIITDENLKDANPIALKCEEIINSFEQGDQVAVVSGFQGVTENNRISTLGRGGSDTTAIILAGALKSERCDIYTDVEGIFTADPRIVAKAKKLDNINYDEMIALSSAGAKVLQAKSAQWAKHYNVKLQVLSSFTGNIGTFVMEKANPIVAIALKNEDSNLDLAKISIISTNIDYQLIINKLTDIEAEFRVISPMQLSIIVKDEDKFDLTRRLHTICGLD